MTGSKRRSGAPSLVSDVARRADGALTAQARTVLVLVLMFTLAFTAVIALKLSQEWREIHTSGELLQARGAAFVAERSAALIARAQGATSSTADSIGAEMSRRGGDPDVLGPLKRLTERADVRHASLITGSGRVRSTSSADAGPVAARAAQARGDRNAWTGLDVDGDVALFVSAEAPTQEGGESLLLVAELSADALVPAAARSQVTALVGPDGRIVAAAPDGALRIGEDALESFGVDEESAAALSAASNSAMRAARADRNGQPAAVGVGDVAGTGLELYVAGPVIIDMARWRRALIFYALLMVAPILVAGGLCAVLVMQMDSIRQARELISDQEKRFRLAIEGARCGVWDWNVANDTVFITKSLAKMLGADAAATMSGAEFLALLRKEDQEKLRLAIRGAAAAGEVDVEFRANSLPVWLQARGRPWLRSDGQLSGRIVGVAIDITEQKGAQARVAAAETRLRAALESMSESFVLWDARRRLVMSNPKFRDFFDLDDKLVKPGAAYDMLELAAQSAIKAVHDRPDDENSELELADGRWVHLSERRTADGGLVSIGTDITALKRQESQLVESEKRLRHTVDDLRKTQERLAETARSLETEKIRAEQASRSKSEFLANMSHELRTPLNAIIGFSEIMQQQMFGPLGDDHYTEYTTDILSSGQHLLALINDILDMSKIEAGKMKLAPEPVYPEELIEQCVRLVRGRAKEARLQLVVEGADLPRIHADPRAIKQVLLNLLSNAVKFTPADGTVKIAGAPEDGGLLIEVSDTGIGIAAEDLARIGRPFEQIESHHAKKHQGSGLGLALSKSLVEMHGGQVEIHSELGQGTSVTVWLPETPPEQPDPPGSGPESSGVARALDAPEPSASYA